MDWVNIVRIKASMNLGLSNDLNLAFPNLNPMERLLIKNQEIKDPN